MGVDVQVFGAGSLGSLIGGLLSHAGLDVRLVGRQSHVSEIRRNGLRIEGKENLTVYPEASTSPGDAEVTLVTVKSYDTREAAESLRGRQNVVVSLQNGMGNEETLSSVTDCRVLAGTTTYGASLRQPGVVGYTGAGTVEVGDPDGGVSETADDVVALLSKGIDVQVRDDMPRRLWSKTAVNAGINPVTAITRLTNGEVIEDDGLRHIVEKAAREVEEVASSEGVDIDGSGDRAVEVARATAPNYSSMLQDLRSRRRTEIDAINGYVVEIANSRGVDVSLNQTLTALVRGAQKSYLNG
ncbi:ketopantoate reductase family protein [Halorutilales archaeon Cl-col2-1]